MEILLADDDLEDVEWTLEAIAKGGEAFHVSLVRDGTEAMEFLRCQGRFAGGAGVPRPDLVLLDMQMPRMDGREVLVEIRSDEQLSHMPVIAMTGSRVLRQILEADNLRVDGYLTKPVSLPQFLEVLDSLRPRFPSLEQVVNPPRVEEGLGPR